jgi:hypothetical protein
MLRVKLAVLLVESAVAPLADFRSKRSQDAAPLNIPDSSEIVLTTVQQFACLEKVSGVALLHEGHLRP